MGDGEDEGYWKPKDARRMLSARGSFGGLWRLEGHVVALATGRKLAQLRGLEEVVIAKSLRKVSDMGKPVRQLGTASDGGERIEVNVGAERHVTHEAEMLIRQSLFYTKENGNLMQSFRFRPTTKARAVTPVLPEVAHVRVSLMTDGQLTLSRMSQNSSSARVVGGPGLGYGLGKMMSASWTHVGRRVKTGGGSGVSSPGVVERWDGVLGAREGRWAWSRIGRCPSWYGRGQCVTFLSGVKVGSEDEVGDNVRAWVKDKRGGWLRSLHRRNERQEDVDDAGVGDSQGAGQVAELQVADVKSYASNSRRKRIWGLL